MSSLWGGIVYLGEIIPLELVVIAFDHAHAHQVLLDVRNSAHCWNHNRKPRVNKTYLGYFDQNREIIVCQVYRVFRANNLRDSLDKIISFELGISSHMWPNSKLGRAERYQQMCSQITRIPFSASCRNEHSLSQERILFDQVTTHLLRTPS